MNTLDLRHKETIRLFLREYFELFFPDLARHMNFQSAQFLDKELISVFKSVGRDVENRADMLILIEIKIDGQASHVVLAESCQRKLSLKS